MVCVGWVPNQKRGRSRVIGCRPEKERYWTKAHLKSARKEGSEWELSSQHKKKGRYIPLRRTSKAQNGAEKIYDALGTKEGETKGKNSCEAKKRKAEQSDFRSKTKDQSLVKRREPPGAKTPGRQRRIEGSGMVQGRREITRPDFI